MTKTSSCPDFPSLWSFLVAESSDSSMPGLEEHILNCEECARKTVELTSDATLVASLRAARQVPNQEASDSLETETDDLSQLIRKLRDLQSQRLNLTNDGCDHQNHGHDFHQLQDWSNCFSPPTGSDEIGRIGPFRVLKLLGHGGMGGVFLAQDSQLSRQVALKVIRPEFLSRPLVTERFMREAAAAAALRSENIVTIYQVGQERGIPFIAMELLRGEALDDCLKREKCLEIPLALKIAKQVALALAIAHERGIIHRDIKPANIWLESNATGDADQGAVKNVKILDFGLARTIDDNQTLTQTGTLIGTPAYMAPEQASGGIVDARTDLFSLGVVLYRMTTGTLPFKGENPLQIFNALATSHPREAQALRPEIPKALSDLIAKLLSKPPQGRPTTSREVFERLAEIERSALLLHQSRDDLRAKYSRFPVKFLLMGLFTAVFFAAIWIVVKDKKGNEIARISVPENANIAVEVDAKTSNAKAVEASAAEGTGKSKGLMAADPKSEANVRAPATDGGVTPLSLSNIDPAMIPKAEHTSLQPDELVAVIGTHRLRNFYWIRSLAIHPTGRFMMSHTIPEPNLCVWSFDSLNRLTDAYDPDIPKQLLQCSDGGSAFVFTPDGKYLITGNGKYSVDLTNGQHPRFGFVRPRPTRTLTHGISSVVSPDARWLVSAGTPGGVFEVFDISGDQFRFVKEVSWSPERQPSVLTLSTNGTRLAATEWSQSTQQGVIQLWNVDWNAEGGPEFSRFSSSLPGDIAELSPDGSTLALSRINDGKTELVDISDDAPRVLKTIEQCRRFCFYDAGMKFAYQSHYDGIIIGNRTQNDWIESHRIGTDSGLNAAFWLSPDGDTLIVSEQGIGQLRVWDLKTSPPAERSPSSAYLFAGISPNGKFLALGGRNMGELWELSGNSPKLVHKFADIGLFWPPSFSYDSRYVHFRSGRSWESRVWKVDEGEPRLVSSNDLRFVCFGDKDATVVEMDFDGESPQVSRSAWEISPTGKLKIVAQSKQQITLPKGVSLTQNTDRVGVFHPHHLTGRFSNIASNGQMQVWEPWSSPKLLFETPPFGTTSLCRLSGSGRYVACQGRNESCAVWDLEQSPPKEHKIPQSGYFDDFLFSQDERLAIVVESVGIKLYEWATNQLISTIDYRIPILSIHLHPDGMHIVILNTTGNVYILRVPELEEYRLAINKHD